MIWDVEFSQEANNYALDSLPYNENVLVAIERLALTKDGVPTEGVYQLLGSWCVWEITDHTVVYEKSIEFVYIYIWLIKPIA